MTGILKKEKIKNIPYYRDLINTLKCIVDQVLVKIDKKKLKKLSIKEKTLLESFLPQEPIGSESKYAIKLAYKLYYNELINQSKILINDINKSFMALNEALNMYFKSEIKKNFLIRIFDAAHIIINYTIKQIKDIDSQINSKYYLKIKGIQFMIDQGLVYIEMINFTEQNHPNLYNDYSEYYDDGYDHDDNYVYSDYDDYDYYEYEYYFEYFDFDPVYDFKPKFKKLPQEDFSAEIFMKDNQKKIEQKNAELEIIEKTELDQDYRYALGFLEGWLEFTSLYKI
jgi:hypothetical protein